jgi:hypothetical protein
MADFGTSLIVLMKPLEILTRTVSVVTLRHLVVPKSLPKRTTLDSTNDFNQQIYWTAPNRKRDGGPQAKGSRDFL